MSTAIKWSIAAAFASAAALLAIPVLIIVLTTPGDYTRHFYSTCAQVLGERANVLPDPPQQRLTTDEVLLRITDTATKLGFGRQGATVTVAIALRATGLANAANPASPDTLRYAHSTQIEGDGAGALGLPMSWGTAAELMTPELSTALALDHMVNAEPQWRDTDPAQLAAQIIGASAADFTEHVANAQAQLANLPIDQPPPSTASTSTTTPPPTSSPPPVTTTHTSTSPGLSPEEASSAASAAPEATNCLAALTTSIPPAATGPNPNGPEIAAAAQRTVDPEASAGPQTSTEASAGPQTSTEADSTLPLTSAQFVAAVITQTLMHPFPDTIADQLRTGTRVDGDPDPGDMVFTDISADEGPHVAGIAVDATTMITTLPGRLAPEQVPIGPNRVIRRIEVNPTS